MKRELWVAILTVGLAIGAGPAYGSEASDGYEENEEVYGVHGEGDGQTQVVVRSMATSSAGTDGKTIQTMVLQLVNDEQSIDELVELVRAWYERTQNAYPETVVPGGFYNTVFTWAIRTFGWEQFMLAAAYDEQGFDRILEGFTNISEKVVQAHIRAGIPVFLCHDDIVWTSGHVFRPAWYRKYVFPRFKRLHKKDPEGDDK